MGLFSEIRGMKHVRLLWRAPGYALQLDILYSVIFHHVALPCYTVVSFLSFSQIQGEDDDDDADAVTYSTVNASSCSARGSAEPSSLYATVNKPDKQKTSYSARH